VDYGLSEGVKGLSDSLNSSRDAARSLSKSIEGIQQDGLDVAKQKAQERLRQKRENDLKSRLAIHKALAEYRNRKLITEEEYRLKTEFVRQYGSKDWEEVLRIKKELERLETAEKAQFDKDLKKVREVQFWCFLVAAWISWYITWGSK